MTIKEKLHARVDVIIASSGDYEAAHSEEDKLHLELIDKYCPTWVKGEIKRLSDADFPRYCA